MTRLKVNVSSGGNHLTMKFFAACVTFAVLVTVGYSADVTKTIKTGTVVISANGNSASLVIKRDDAIVFELDFNTTSTSINDNTLTLNDGCETDTTCIGSSSATYIKVRTNSDSEVVTINRTISDSSAQLTDCYSLADGTQWFGGPEQGYLLWPLQDQKYDNLNPVSGNVQLFERYWLSSKGVYVLVAKTSPLFLDQNNIKNRSLCLLAKNGGVYRNHPSITLDYEIGVFANPRVAQEYVIGSRFGKPTGRPDDRSVSLPIWSTWARDKKDVNDSSVRAFADEIVNNGFENSQLEIDDNWETCYGSFNFDTNKFPNISQLLTDLKAKGFRVTLWLHPYINKGCNDGEGYDYALNNNYFVKTIDGSVQASWWDGSDAGAIDFTNTKAAEWWVARIKKLSDLGFDSFKFDAGDATFLPSVMNLNVTVWELHPDVYDTYYTTAVAQNFGNNIEVRVGWGTQQLPIWVRMTDKDTNWGLNNGLATLITALLTMNINGYVLVLPDMVGGNGYNGDQPSKEIFIRWLQANVFMPSIQYSYAPWDFDDETISLAKTFTNLHANVSSKIIEAMDKSVQTGAPVNPPIWWVDPTNEDAHKIGDEFLLGEEILVAPVITEGATSRDVYLPSGKWQDANTQEIHDGPIWLRNYSAPLSLLPYFYKQ